MKYEQCLLGSVGTVEHNRRVEALVSPVFVLVLGLFWFWACDSTPWLLIVKHRHISGVFSLSGDGG